MLTYSKLSGRQFPKISIAFAIVDCEIDESWTWFMQQLSGIVRDETDLTFV